MYLGNQREDQKALQIRLIPLRQEKRWQFVEHISPYLVMHVCYRHVKHQMQNRFKERQQKRLKLTDPTFIKAIKLFRLRTKTIVQREQKMKQHQIHKIDLTKIEGSGDFPCPSCSTMISPEDETEDIYTVLDTKMNGAGADADLEELTIQCNKCGSQIHLVGFLHSPPSSPKKK